MKNHTQKILQKIRSINPVKRALIIFAILIIFIIVIEKPGKESHENITYLNPKLNIETAQEIKIKYPDKETENILIEKKEGNWWLVNGHSFPADEPTIIDFLTTIHNLREGSIASKNPERMSLFDVDESKGILINIIDNRGRTVADFYAGKISQLDHQYIRKTNSNEVRQIQQSLKSFLTKQNDQWKDKTILVVNEKEVMRLNLKKENIESTIEKNDTNWILLQTGKEPDELATRTLFEQLKLVRAKSFVENSEASQLNFDKPNYSISVRSNDNKVHQLNIIKTDEGKLYVQSNQNDFIYEIDKNAVDSIFELSLNGGNK